MASDSSKEWEGWKGEEAVASDQWLVVSNSSKEWEGWKGGSGQWLVVSDSSKEWEGWKRGRMEGVKREDERTGKRVGGI